MSHKVNFKLLFCGIGNYDQSFSNKLGRDKERLFLASEYDVLFGLESLDDEGATTEVTGTYQNLVSLIEYWYGEWEHDKAMLIATIDVNNNDECVLRARRMLQQSLLGKYVSPNGSNKAREHSIDNEPTLLCGNPVDLNNKYIVLTETVKSHVFDDYDEAVEFSYTLKPVLAMGVYKIVGDNQLTPLKMHGGYNSHREMFSIHKEFTLISDFIS